MKPNDNIKYIKGIGEARAKLFNRLGIYTAGDLLYHLPRGYEDRSEIRSISELMDGDTVCVRGCLAQGVKSYRARNRVTVTQTAVSDGTGIMRVTWFNSPYISATLKQGAEFTFYGKAVYKGRQFEMVNPVTEADSGSHKTGKIVPVYPSTSGLRQQNIRNAMEAALDAVAGEITEVLPESIRLEYNLMPIGKALRKVHFPGTLEEFEDARRRLAFEELFVLQTGIALLRDERYRYRSTPIKNVKCIAEFAAELPFELTGAQKRVINEICADLKRDVPMNRLVQGDVGSGKTMVAAAAMYAVVMSGYQAVLMAPTEILAAQHYKNLSALFGRFGWEGTFSAASRGCAGAACCTPGFCCLFSAGLLLFFCSAFGVCCAAFLPVLPLFRDAAPAFFCTAGCCGVFSVCAGSVCDACGSVFAFASEAGAFCSAPLSSVFSFSSVCIGTHVSDSPFSVCSS